MRRVVVTGMGVLSSLGSSLKEFSDSLKKYENKVVCMKDWDKFDGLHTRLAAPILDFLSPAHYGRRETRSMGRVSILATYASELALKDANLLGDPIITSGRTGVAYGSSSGSIDSILDFYSMMADGVVSNVTSSTYIKMMPHTCPVNISVFFKTTGRLVPTGTACTSGSLAIGSAYELIQAGKQDIMIAGGAEELSPTQSVVFDTLFATSTKNQTPKLTPSPYDKDRDGLVIGEGAGTLILEEYEHAKKRDARIYAEVVGFATNSDGTHVTRPNKDTMAKAIELALLDASLSSDQIQYVSGHGTSTEHGDIAESQATYLIFRRAIPISSLKSYTGHTLGACGAIESIASILMMNEGRFHPTLNLENIDPNCAPLDYIQKESRSIDAQYVMNNNFAFGGINTSLIFKKVSSENSIKI